MDKVCYVSKETSELLIKFNNCFYYGNYNIDNINNWNDKLDTINNLGYTFVSIDSHTMDRLVSSNLSKFTYHNSMSDFGTMVWH